jgi:hypothetical protein
MKKNIRKYNLYFFDPLIILKFSFAKFFHRPADLLRDAMQKILLAGTWQTAG